MDTGSLAKADFEQLSDFVTSFAVFCALSGISAVAGSHSFAIPAASPYRGYAGRGWATVGELADRLQAQHHGVVALVSRCESLGWVERRPGRDDRRVVEIHLTPAGEARSASWPMPIETNWRRWATVSPCRGPIPIGPGFGRRLVLCGRVSKIAGSHRRGRMRKPESTGPGPRIPPSMCRRSRGFWPSQGEGLWKGRMLIGVWRRLPWRCWRRPALLQRKAGHDPGGAHAMAQAPAPQPQPVLHAAAAADQTAVPDPAPASAAPPAPRQLRRHAAATRATPAAASGGPYVPAGSRPFSGPPGRFLTTTPMRPTASS